MQKKQGSFSPIMIMIITGHLANHLSIVSYLGWSRKCTVVPPEQHSAGLLHSLFFEEEVYGLLRYKRQTPQSRHSAKLFLQSSELGLPHRRMCPPPLGFGWVAHSLAGEGVGESQFRRGVIHCGTLRKYVLCERPEGRKNFFQLMK